MVSVTAFEAKTRIGKLLKRVAQGEQIVITRHEKAVARLVPEGGQNLTAVSEAVAGILELRKQIAVTQKRKSKISGAEFKSWITEGRR